MLRLRRLPAFLAVIITAFAIFSQGLAGAPAIAGTNMADGAAGVSQELFSCAPESDGETTPLPAEETTGTPTAAAVTPEAQTSASVISEPVAAPEVPAAAATATVKPIRLNSTVTSSLPAKDASIAYTFTLAERGYIQLSLSHSTRAPAADTGWVISLYEEYYLNGSDGETGLRLLTRLKTDWTAKENLSAKIGVLPGSFRAVVTSDKKYAADSFGLRVGFTASGDYEIEYNDSITRYTSVYSDKTVYGSSALRDSADIDYYMFKVTEKGFTELVFTHADLSLASVGWRVSVIDANGREYYYQTSRFMDKTIESGALGLAPGCYFVKIEGHVYSPEQYSLTVASTAADNFEIEPNDTRAQSITPGVKFRGATTSRSGAADKDCFAFTLNSDGYITVTFEHKAETQARNGWNLKLYDSKNTLLYSDIIDRSVSRVISPQIGLAKGSYYLCIDNENMYLNTAIYTVTVNNTAASDYEKEPNNSFANATVLGSGSSVTGSMLSLGVEFDTDFYKITVPGGPLTVSFNHAALAENRDGWIITLYDSAGAPVAPTDKNGNVFKNVLGNIIYGTSCKWNKADTDIFFYNVPAGTYFINIDTALYFSSINYTVSYH